MPLDTARLLELLRCPQCRSEVLYDAQSPSFVCANGDCRLRFPIRDEIPVMLVGDAEQLDQSAWEEVIGRAERSAPAD